MLVSSYTEACQKIHGHNYKVEVVIECASGLNKDGMVIDFGKIKAIFEPYIALWDHKLILRSEYTEPDEEQLEKIRTMEKNGTFFLPVNPTAENMAKLLYDIMHEQLKDIRLDKDRECCINGYVRNVRVHSVRVTETDSSWAEYIG